MSPAWIDAGLVVVGTAGVADSLFFLGLTYRWWPGDRGWVPRVCRLDDGACRRVVFTRWARILGPPNAALGLIWFLVLVAWGVLGFSEARPDALCPAIIAGAAASVAASVVLACALLARLRTRCVLCFFGHGLCLAGLALSLASCS